MSTCPDCGRRIRIVIMPSLTEEREELEGERAGQTHVCVWSDLEEAKRVVTESWQDNAVRRARRG